MTSILFVILNSIQGGAQISLLRLVANIDKSKFSVSLFCPDGYLADEARRIGLDVYAGDFSIAGLIRLARLIREKHFDVVKTELLGAALIGALAVALSRRSPRLVVTVNNAILYPGMPWWRRGLVRLSYRVISFFEPVYLTKSQKVKEELMCVVSSSALQVHNIPNPIAFEHKGSLDERARVRGDIGIKDGEVAIGVIGALTHQKGHCYLIEAGKVITAHNDKVRFYFVGDGPLRAKLEKFASRTCPQKFAFLGRRNDSVLCAWAMDIVVVPSLFEGLPNALIEALSMARPVVVTAVGGCDEIVQDGESGLVVRPADAKSLAEAICWMLDHPECAYLMGQRGEERVREKYSVSKVVRTISALLETNQPQALANAE